MAAYLSKTCFLYFTLDMGIHIRLFRCLHRGHSWSSGKRISNDKTGGDVSSHLTLWPALSNPCDRKMTSYRDSSTALTVRPPHSSVPFITTVLLANVPQLLLSVWYFGYNAILTRLQLSKEWAMFSTSFRPLRVSQPRYFLALSFDTQKNGIRYANKRSYKGSTD